MSASVSGEAGGIGDGHRRADRPGSGPAQVIGTGPATDRLARSVLPGLGEGRCEVCFGNGRWAGTVAARPDADAEGVLAQLGLEPTRPVLVLLGGADSLGGADRAEQIDVLGRAIARAASRAGAIVVDGATDSGMMAAVGAAVAADGHRVPLLGVAPTGLVTADAAADATAAGADRVPLEQNHSHLVLVDASKWGDETDLLLDLAGALAPVRPVAVVVGGGDVTTKEAEQAVRRRWRVFVVEGTGGTADALAARHRSSDGGSGAGGLGEVRRLDGADAEQVTRRLAWSLQDTPELKLAWERFARYDTLAVRLRRSFERLQASILLLGITATLLALVHHSLGSRLEGSWGLLRDALHWTVVAVPIVISTLIAFTARVQAGKRWVLLRGAAEATKREIFRYRTRTGLYAPNRPGAERTPDEELLERIGTVDAVLMKTEVSGGALPAYEGPLPPPGAAGDDDDGLSPLDPERYLELRVCDQRRFYRSKTVRLERKLRNLQLLTVAAGGVGTLVAAAGFELWVGLTTAIAGGVAAHLGYLQVEGTLVAYNQAIAKLEEVETRALLHLKAGTIDEAYDDLVERAETAIHSEHGSWTQQMHESLEHLRPKDQPGAVATGDGAAQPGAPAQPRSS